MLIDFHTHIFPDALAAKTLPRLSHIAYDSPYYTDGTERGAREAMAAWGVDRAVVLHIATKPGQQKTVNRFAAEVQARNPNMLCFGAVHPKDPGAAAEIAEIRAAGLCGVKLHPAYQECYFGDEAFFPIYAAIEEAGLPLLLHAGRDPVSRENFAPADQIAAVARAFPKLTLIAAHMGALGQTEPASAFLCDLPNVYFDTAMSSVYLEPDEYLRLIRRKGADRVLFGTDCPWNTVENELGMLERLGLTGEELEMIKWKNALRLLPGEIF